MADEHPQQPWDAPLGDMFADVPLFREIRRVLMSSQGHAVNWELARQVGVAAAQLERPDPEATGEDRQAFEEAARLAELHVADFTGLESPTDVAAVRAVRRADWVASNVDGLRGLIEPAAQRVGRAVQRAQAEGGPTLPEDLPEGVQGVAGQIQQALGLMAPLLLGVQVGQVLGALGQRVLGQYDIAVPRPGPGELLFVVSNVAQLERDWSLPPTEFRTWVALHEVTHRFELARPWARDRFADLVQDFTSTVELDLGSLQERLAQMDVSDPEALQRALEQDEDLFGAVLDDEQRIKLGRVQAFMSAAEGYAEHVTHSLGAKLLPSSGMIEEAMRRYREGEHGDPVFERLLGIEMKREQYVQGRAFCDAVVELTDEFTLARMWDGPDAMPSLPEIEEPRLWLARSV